MKIEKKILTAALLGASALSLASCGGNSSTDTFKIFLYQEDVKFNEDMDVFKAANEYAGIKLEGELQKYDTNYDTIYNLRGKKCHLVVNDQDTIEATALNDDIFLDFTPLIEEHAPNLAKYFKENPEKKAWATAADGKIYGIPFYTDGETAKGFFVRKDWINTLAANKKLPAGVKADKLDDLTVEQFEALLTAFKDNKDLLGVPKDDPIYPYFDRDNEFAISELSSLWGATGEFYYDEAAKTVKFGPMEAEFQNAMMNIQSWYKKGLIEPTILDNATNEDKRVNLFASNQGGATHDWIGTTYSFNEDMYAANLVDDFDLVCILPPTRTVDGKQVRLEPTIRKQIGKVTAINKYVTSEEDQIKLVKWIDYFFSDEGHITLNYGIKDVHWKEEGGKKVFTDKILNDNNTALANLYNIGAQMQTPGVQTFDYEEAWLSTEAKDAMEKYNPVLDRNYNKLIYPNIKLNNEDYKAVNTARSMIKIQYEDYVNKFMKGTLPVNDANFAKFKEALVKAGVNTVIEKLNAAVNSK